MYKDIRLKLSPPWITYVNEIKAMFGNDPEISIVYDNEEVAVRLYVDNAKKAEAIAMLLPEEAWFGNVCLGINVIPANGKDFEALEKITNDIVFSIAFENNPVFAYSKTITGILSNNITYVVFKNRVVQFFNDNLNDIYGNVSTLYEDIARELFEDTVLQGVFYCTDIEEKVGMINNWP